MNLKCDAVLEGGGVRGIGHVGAAYALEQSGYSFENLAGSSAGAIVAALLAVGFSATEIRRELENLDYKKFQQPTVIDNFGPVGKLVNLTNNFGIYSTSYFYKWFSGLLAQKGKKTFGDIRLASSPQAKYTYKLQVTASDVTAQKLLVLPWDIRDFGIDPDKLQIADAVRMSMSIPFFYEPVVIRDKRGKEHIIVDGGLLSNYPIWMLDDGSSNPPYPTFGFKFIAPPKKATFFTDPYDENINFVEYVQSITETLLKACDNTHISESKGDLMRSILIPCEVKVHGKRKEIKSTDFDITPEETQALFMNGYNAATNFLKKWNFDVWKRAYRSSHR